MMKIVDMKKTVAATASLCMALAAAAAEKSPQVPPQKFATVQRVEAAPSIDGDLGDSAWRSVSWNSGYVLAKKGGEPSEQTRFKALYTDDALYVAAESFANFDGYGVYAYNESNYHPWNQWDGMEWSYVFQTADGVCDLINWEGQREACDDVRYATLLLRLADERPGDETSKAAKAWLDTLDPAHPAYDPVETRSKMVEFILRLLPASPGT